MWKTPPTTRDCRAHHLQISIAQELEGVPDFRKFGGYTAFEEGWGLYAGAAGERT